MAVTREKGTLGQACAGLWDALRQRCPRCAESFTVTDYQTACPACAAPDTECVGGEELELSYLELEEA